MRRKPIPKAIDSDHLVRLHDRAKRIATIYRFNQDAEDLAQDVALRYLEGKNSHSTVTQTLIDAVRHHYGASPRKGVVKSKKYEAKNVSVELIKTLPDLRSDRDGNLEFMKLIESLSVARRMIIILYFKWGLGLLEIAEIFNCSEANVSVMLEETLKKLKTLVKPTQF